METQYPKIFCENLYATSNFMPFTADKLVSVIALRLTDLFFLYFVQYPSNLMTEISSF